MSARDEQLQEQFDVSFALAIATETSTGPCPDEEELVAWHEKRLTGTRRTELAAHLASCNSCYLTWCELAAVKELSVPGVQVAAAEGERKKKTLFEKIAHILQPRPLAIGGLGTVLAAVALVIIMMPGIRALRIGHQLEKSYLSLSPAPASRSESVYRSKSLNIAPGFIAVPGQNWHPQTAGQQAFAAGVLEGIRRIESRIGLRKKTYPQLPEAVTMAPSGVSEKDWLRRKRALRLAGQWAVVMESSCAEPALYAPSFWAEQKSILASLEKEVSSYPENDRFTRLFESWLGQEGGETDVCRKGRELLKVGFERNL